MKRGDVCQAPYGRVRLTGADSNGFPCIYESGIFAGREARIEKRILKLDAGKVSAKRPGEGSNLTATPGIPEEPAGRDLSRQGDPPAKSAAGGPRA